MEVYNKNNKKIYLSVIIPVYNEEKRLPKTLEKIDGYLKKQAYDSEIIVVSDGSTDKTVEITENLMKKIKNLKILDFKERQGKGFGVKRGLLAAKGEYRIFTDADNSTSIDQVEKMWPEFEKGYDIIIGSRDIKGAVLAVPQPWLRRVVFGGGFRLLRKIIIGLWKIKDTQCGFKGFKEKAAKDIFPKITILGFGFDPEVLVIAKKMGYKIKEIPITWVNDVESKVKLKSVVKMFLETLKIRINAISGKYKAEKENKEPAVWKKTDLISALIIGEAAGWLIFAILKTLEIKIIDNETYLMLFLALFFPLASLACLYLSYLLGKKIPVIFQAGKFIAVGISNTLIDWGILNLLIFISGIAAGFYYSVFKGLSFVVAVINSYFWNKFWTFRKEKAERTGKEILQFLVISVIGIGINVGIASLVVNAVGSPAGISLKVWATAGAAMATVISMVWNFLGYKFIVFKK